MSLKPENEIREEYERIQALVDHGLWNADKHETGLTMGCLFAYKWALGEYEGESTPARELKRITNPAGQ